MSKDRIESVTVYCSSSRHVPAVYFEAAAELGSALARANWRLVYGGNRIGCMGALADAARAAGGKVTGITPQLLVDEGLADEHCEPLVVTLTMRERKALLEEHGDAYIALPGGIGTLEEVFEILVGKMLGYHPKPIVLLNIENYYGPLLAMIEHGIEHRFIRTETRNSYYVAGTIAEAIQFLTGSGSQPVEPGASGLTSAPAVE